MRKVGYFKDRIPVSCHIFNNKGLSLEPSDELKEKFENYFHMINCIVEKVSKDDMNEIDTEKLKQDYKLIRDMVIDDIRAVSYTHLDVYKRQVKRSVCFG